MSDVVRIEIVGCTPEDMHRMEVENADLRLRLALAENELRLLKATVLLPQEGAA